MPLMRIDPNTKSFDPKREEEQLNERVLKCTNCGCHWMELIHLRRFDKDTTITFNQKPRTLDDGFFILKCPKCNEMYEPPLQYSGLPQAARLQYDKFLDQMLDEKK